MNNLSDTIKGQRNLKNLTQADLAEFAEVNINTIVKIEKDVNKTSVETLRKILDVLDMELVVVPKRDSKAQFIQQHFPHLVEEGISTYLLRIISVIQKHRAMNGVKKNKDVFKIDFTKLILRLYDTKLKTEEGQMLFYRTLRVLPKVTKKMCEEHIILWNVESVNMEEDNIIFNCEKIKSGKFNYSPLPSFLLPPDKETLTRDNYLLCNKTTDFIRNLHPKQKIRLMEIYDVEDKAEQDRILYNFLHELGLDSDGIELIVQNIDKNSIKDLL